MRKAFVVAAFWAVSFWGQIVFANYTCNSDFSGILKSFLEYDDKVFDYISQGNDKSNPQVLVKTYLLYSQEWPVNEDAYIHKTKWKHHLVLYIPWEIVKGQDLGETKALLYVGGGRNRNIGGWEEFKPPREQPDYAKIAADNQAIVVELQDVPNQYLFIKDQDGQEKPFKEDEIIAYSFKRFMDKSCSDPFIAGHLPMAKAAVKAMDAVEKIVKAEFKKNITGFILSGASKRGWAIWLAALGDRRVEAIIPIVIDVLNTQKNLTHICQSKDDGCPPAFQDYQNCGINVSTMKNLSFTKLMEIEDPFKYKNYYQGNYGDRLAIPKYIINASGDDFFVPDSSHCYFKGLPGNQNYIRYLPNANHYFRGNPISDLTQSLSMINDSLNTYFFFFLNKNKVNLPKLNWTFKENQIDLNSSLKPWQVKLWTANNATGRNFRFLHSYSKLHLYWRKFYYYLFGELCDTCYQDEVLPIDSQENGNCKIIVNLKPFKKGWQASFVELHYKILDRDFVLTTEVYIRPK